MSHPHRAPSTGRSALLAGLACAAALASCAKTSAAVAEHPPQSLIAGAQAADDLIQPGEEHFARLWKLTSGGENAEGYFSFSGDRLVWQRRSADEGVECDRIYVSDPQTGERVQVSDGVGVTTCAYFLPGDEAIVYASTRAEQEACPPRPDHSRGYVWKLYPEYELWRQDIATGALTRLTDEPGYDAEATVSPRGDRIVFTSMRTGDPELWTCALDGSDLVRVTDAPGYDGGAFFSHDGERLVFRATAFTPGKEASEQAEFAALLEDSLVRPSAMELMLVDPDGSNRAQLTHLGGANFAPFFFPDDESVIFASNHHDTSNRRRPNFDLFAIGVDGEGLERITTYEGFDSFPMFSSDGRWLVFASNRGGEVDTETNLFLAEWR